MFHMLCFCYGLSQLVAQGRLQLGKAGAIGSSNYKDLKLKKKKEKKKRAVVYGWVYIVPCGLRVLTGRPLPTCSLPIANRP